MQQQQQQEALYLGNAKDFMVSFCLHFGFVVDRCFTEPLPSIDLTTATFLAFEGLLFFLGKDSLKSLF
jgi:hypothetical protein